MFHWYVARTAVGRENKVSRDINQRLANAGEQAYMREVLIPTETVQETVGGKLVKKERQLLPGYIFLHMDLAGAHSTVKNTKGVIELVGSGDRPAPLTKSEVDSMLGRRSQDNTRLAGPRFELGQQINIIEGPFAGFTGVVTDPGSEHNRKVKVDIEIFGRPTSAEIDYTQVQSGRR